MKQANVVADDLVNKMAGELMPAKKKKEVAQEVKAVVDVVTDELAGKDALEVTTGAGGVRQWKLTPDVLDYSREFKPVKKMYGGNVREMRPDGVFANLVCPEGKLHCIKVEEGDAVIIVRNNGDFVDMVVKGSTNKAEALRAAARKFVRLIKLG